MKFYDAWDMLQSNGRLKWTEVKQKDWLLIQMLKLDEYMKVHYTIIYVWNIP